MSTAVATAPPALMALSATPSRMASSSNPNSHSRSPPSLPGESKSRKQNVPTVVVKEEPTSPTLNTRHRPRKLDLSGNNNKIAPAALSARPLTSKDALHDVGLACLSPGFNTSDPAMQQQLQRSMSVRDQQRQLIEARQKGQKPANTSDTEGARADPDALFRPNKTPGTSRRKGPPPALSIAPPHHARFASERVIQSAPLGVSFTGLRRNPEGGPMPTSRPGSNLAQPPSSRIHHAPAIQTANRLPPIADVFPGELQSNGQLRPNQPPAFAVSGVSHQQALPSPGFPQMMQQHQKPASPESSNNQHSQPPAHTLTHTHTHTSSSSSTVPRSRDYKSAEEAVRAMTGGRDDLLPRLVHYVGGNQPPTPPSPGGKTGSLSRRRDRDEYEGDASSPPLGRQPVRRVMMAGGISRATASEERHQKEKKERFMRLMEEAWDLFHT